MPWHIEERGNQYCVIKDMDNTNEGCHGSHDEAMRHMAALYASEETKMNYDIKQADQQIEPSDQSDTDEDGRLNRVKRAFREFLTSIRSKDTQLEKSSFKAIGNRLWIAQHTNSFLDRDNDILTRKSHAGYVDRVQRGLVPTPELWFYHIPGTRHGKALWIDLVQVDENSPVSVVALGEFDDTPSGRAAEDHYLKTGANAYKLSHGYFAPEWAIEQKSGHRLIDVYNTFEITTLPAEHEAESNLFTEFVVQESHKMMTPEVENEIRARFGDAMIEQYEAAKKAAQEGLKAYQDFGAEYKDFVDSLGDESSAITKDADGESGESNPPVEAQLLTDVLGMTNEMMEKLPVISQAMQGLIQQVNDLKSQQAQNQAALEKRMKAFDAFMSQTPSGVDDSLPIAEGTDGLEDAEGNMKARLAESQPEVDSFWKFNTNGSKK